ERQQDTSTGVGVGSVHARHVGQSLNDAVLVNIKDLGSLCCKHIDRSVPQKMHEWIHVVWLIVNQNVHANASAIRNTVPAQDFVCWIVVRRNSGIQSVKGATGNKDTTICKSLSGWIP